MAARRAGAKVYHTQYTLSPLARGGVTTIHDVSFYIGPEWIAVGLCVAIVATRRSLLLGLVLAAALIAVLRALEIVPLPA